MWLLTFCSAFVIISFNDYLRTTASAFAFDEADEKLSLFNRIKEAAYQKRRNGGGGLFLEEAPFSIGDYFLPDIVRSECGAWDSCVLRCGDPIKPPYMCSCDPECRTYGDCCVDHSYYCGMTPSETETNQNVADSEFEPNAGNHTEDEKCHKWYGNPFYGLLYDNENLPKFGRRCVLDIPPWCNPNTAAYLQWDFSQSLSLLLNFGPEGWNNDLLFSSDFHDPNRCPNIWEIWDPFTQLCRPIECTDDYVLEDGRCVWDGKSGKPPSRDLVGYTTKKANITFYGNILMKDTVGQFGLLSIQKDMVQTLSKKIRIDSSRFSHVKIQESAATVKNPWFKTTTHRPPGADWGTGNDTSQKYKDFHSWILTEEGFPVTVNFELNRKAPNSTNDLTIEQILSILHEAVAIRAVLQSNNLVPMKINAVEKSVEKEEVEFFGKWCRGGDLESYWNEEFKVVFIMKNKTEEEGPGLKLTMAVKIPANNKTYDEGTYVANLLYQSTDMNAEAANVSGVVIVCENRPKILDPSCVRVVLNETEYTIEPDGALVLDHEIPGAMSVYNRTEYEFKDNGNALVCINYLEARAGSLIPRELTSLEKFASYTSMILLMMSLLSLLLTILTYGLFSELRTLPGWCLLHLCLTKFSFFLLFSIGAHQATAEHQVLCTTISIATHLSALLFFAWSSVISFDLFATFAKFQPVVRSKEEYLSRYSCFAYGLPTSIVFISAMIQFHSDIEIDYGKNVCWIGNSMAALYVFAIPIAISILCNIAFFALTIIGIKKVSKMATKSNLGQRDRARFTLYLRMSSVQCFAWIFGYLAVFSHFDETLSRIFEMLFIILSSLQGVYIFVAFVVNTRVKQLYVDRFLSQKPKTRGFGFSVRSTVLRRTPSSEPEADKARNKVTVDAEPSNKLAKESDSDGTGAKKPIRQCGQTAGRTVSNETCVSYVDD